uniref:Curved DNA-binding protein n=1 Tax=Candidatus Kentrum sp. UNK TaxID=2126344 RepID=A0A451AXP8_9GAMM|nr:MAG: curved DNA-binding protein [Candidatus Kentron sp. UNK]VFK70811.1 MAG: curved DNA-binding protein [Candidatus Kentron sp. UNK]
MKYKDYYQLLGVTRAATPDEIKRAYRRRARKYHPDVSKEPNAEERFKEVQEAYEVLKDPKKRDAYNHLGENWKTGQEFRPPPDWGGGVFEFNTGGFSGSPFGFSDFFESLFGGEFQRGGAGFHTRNTRAPGPRQGRHEHTKIRITLEEAYQGVERTLHVEGGTGVDGRMSTKARQLKVKIPAGITQGQQIRLAGQGGPGAMQGRKGDLYLKVEFLPHPLFRSEGKDLHLELPITPWEAALGATIKVPTLGGDVDLKIPADSQSGKKLRLKGRGLGSTTRGDQYIVLKIVAPPANSGAARELYERMAREMSFDPRVHMRK